MKDPNLSELIRICIRCWLYLVPQAFLGIHLFSMFMRKKHSMKPLMIWQLLRVILIGGISDIILRGYYGNESWWEILMMFLSVVIMIANTVLFYYSFEGSLPKVVLGGMLADIVTAMIHYPAICIVDLLAGRQLYVLKCPVEPWDLLIPVLEYLFYQLEKKTIIKVLKGYRDFEARYPKIIWVLVYFLPVMYYVPSGLKDTQVMFLDDIMIILIMIFSILSVLRRQHQVLADYEFLSEQQKMAEYHYQILTEQIPQMEQYQQTISEQMEKIMAGAGEISGETLKQYAENLKTISSQVRQGIYCKDRMIDAVLCAWKSNLEKKKIELHYQIAGYDRGEIAEKDLAKILIGILNWGETLVKKEEQGELQLKITGVKNQLILECLTSSRRQNPMSRKLFRGLLKKYNGKMQEKKEKTGEIGLTVILSRQVIL